MRRLARYSFEVNAGDLPNLPPAWDSLCQDVERWLSEKGEPTDLDDAIKLADGRVASLTSQALDNSKGRSKVWRVDEPVGQGRFCTAIGFAQNDRLLTAYCELEAGNPGTVAPVYFEARCPRIVRDTLRRNLPWKVGGSPAPATVKKWRGAARAGALRELIHNPDRRLPLIVVSEEQGFVLHPRVSDELAYDLAGLAQVVEIDEALSWELTKQLGKEWSCYNGAIRLYWSPQPNDDPFRHQLWTASRLMTGVADTTAASARIKKQIRRKLFNLSTLTLNRSPLFAAIEEQARVDAVAGSTDDRELAELYSRENAKLRKELERLGEENRILVTDLALARENFRALSLTDSEEEPDLEPESETPPETVADAVDLARSKFAAELVFGDDVAKGVKSLAPNAGPPDQILGFLEGLAGLAKAIHTREIGRMPMVNWLREKGFSASPEAETDRNNPRHKQKRTWDDGLGARREYDYHLKVSEGTSPDRCPRIYFDYDKKAKKVTVGWVGRHFD